MTEPSTTASGDERTDPGWITRRRHPGDLFRDEPLADGQAGIELFDGSTSVDNRARPAALGHAIVQHLDAPDADTVAAAGLDPAADPGHTWPDVTEPAADGQWRIWSGHAWLALSDLPARPRSERW